MSNEDETAGGSGTGGSGAGAAYAAGFLGHYVNRLDAKLRVSVPSAFRARLRALGGCLVLRNSHKYPCLEAWPLPEFDALAAPLQRLDLFSERYDDLAASIYASATAVEPDKEGRIVLPETFVTYANLSDQVLFIGIGRLFMVWEPAAGRAFMQAARERARAGGLTLPAAGP